MNEFQACHQPEADTPASFQFFMNEFQACHQPEADTPASFQIQIKYKNLVYVNQKYRRTLFLKIYNEKF
jgi:hypothetical protein